MTVTVPPVNVQVVDGNGRPTREYNTFFRGLVIGLNAADSINLDGVNHRLDHIEAEIADATTGNIQGADSIQTQGVLPGYVYVTLQGDVEQTPALSFYGAINAGERGWQTYSANFAAKDNGDGTSSLDLADLANSGTGTLQAVTFDAQGRASGYRDATTTDLAEGSNLYFTDARADARAAAAVATHAAETDPHPQYTTAAEAAAVAPVQSVNGMTGDVEIPASGGTVTSVALSVPTSLVVAGSPITSSGTFTVTYASGYQGYLTTEAAKLSGIATGATVGATWGVNLSGIPTNVASWAGIDPSVKADDSGVVHKTGVESIGGAKTFNWQIVVNPDTAAPNGTAAIQINDVAGTAARLQSDSIGPFSFIGRRYMTSLSSPTAVPDGTEIFSLSCAAYDGSSIGSATGIFSFFADGNQSTSNHGCYANIRMTPNGSTSRGTYYWLRTTAFSGGTDNFQALGDAALRWSVVYAGTGTISTSDAREKTTVRPFTPAELAAAAELGREIGGYQWLAMVEAKGGAARQHIGLTVQRAIEVMESHGLNPFGYGFICYDEWPEQAEIIGDDGDVVQEHRPAGDRYSFRTDELLMFMARGFAARLDALESA